MALATIPTAFSPQVVASVPANDTYGNGFRLVEPGVYTFSSPDYAWYYASTDGLPIGSMTQVAAGAEVAFTVAAGDSPLGRYVRSNPGVPLLLSVVYDAPVQAGGDVVEVPLTDAASIATDASLGTLFTVTIDANRAMAAPTNPAAGDRIIYRITQGTGGSRTITWDPAFRFSTGLPAPTLSTAVGDTDYVMFIYNDADSCWDCLGANLGFT